MMPRLIRRDFLKLSLISFLSSFFGCSRSPELSQDINSAMKEEAFGSFLDVVFPTHLLGLQKYQKNIIGRLKNLNDSDSKKVARCYHLFKDKYENEHGSFNVYTLAKGEGVIAQLLVPRFFSGHSKAVNQALDIIYEQIARIRELQGDLWGRKYYSEPFKMCAYWNNYDQPIT